MSTTHARARAHAHTQARTSDMLIAHFVSIIFASPPPPPSPSLSTDISCLSLTITNSLYSDQTQRFVGSDFDTDRVQETERVCSFGLCIIGMQHAITYTPHRMMDPRKTLCSENLRQQSVRT